MATTGTSMAVGAALAIGLGVGLWWGGESSATESRTLPASAEQEVSASAAGRPASARRQAARIVELERSLDAARAEAEALRATVVVESADDSASDTDEETAPRVARGAFAFPEYPQLADIDWELVGRHSRAMIEILDEFAQLDASGERPTTPRVGEIQKRNGVYVAETIGAIETLPGMFANSQYTHPAFVANLLAATLRAVEHPLTPAQVTAVGRTAREFSDEDARRRDAYDETTPRLQQIYEEADLRARFVAHAMDGMSVAQRDALAPPAIRGSLRYDMHSDGTIWQQVLRPIEYAEGDAAALAAGALGALDAKLRLSESERSGAETIVAEWARDVRPVSTDESRTTSVVRVRAAALRTLTLVRRLIDDLALSGKQLEAARQWDDVLLPMPRTR